MKFRRSYLRVLMIIAVMSSIKTASAQDGGKQKSVEKQRKEFLKLQDERKADSDKAKAEKQNRHIKIQGKETRKRMKKNKKKVRRLQNNKHEKSFIQRLFSRKRRRA